MLILKAQRDKEHRQNRFYALFKGVDLDEENTSSNGSNESLFEQTKRQAEAAIAGKTEQQMVFDLVGIDEEIDPEILELRRLEQM